MGGFKKFALLLAVFFIIKDINHRLALPPKTSSTVTPGQANIVMYSTSWCGYCAKLREYFESNHIKYTEKDVEKSAEADREWAALGVHGVPAVLIDGNLVNGTSPKDINAALHGGTNFVGLEHKKTVSELFWEVIK